MRQMGMAWTWLGRIEDKLSRAVSNAGIDHPFRRIVTLRLGIPDELCVSQITR